MINNWFKVLSCVAVVLTSHAALAKLPVPSEEAKAKAAEATAKTAWAGKVDGYKLCLSQDKVVAHYKKAPTAKPAAAPAKAVSAPAAACADPGPFVYPPVAAASAAAPAASTAAVASPVKKP